MKVAITGVSGYLGTLLTKKLMGLPEIESLTGIDVKEPTFTHSKFKFLKCDIRDQKLIDCLSGIDVAVHLAFIVQEIKDKKLIYSINVNGTKNFLMCCNLKNIKKIIIASSLAAYGSHKRNIVLTEDTPLLGNISSYYSYTKRIVEELADDYLRKHPETIITRLRPSIVIGKNINNFFIDVIKSRTIYYVKGNEYLPVVFEEDVAEAFKKVILEDHPGAFNIHGGNLSVKKMAELLNFKARGVPYFLAKFVADIAYFFGLSPISSHWVVLGRYPFEVSSEKAEKVLGWKPTVSAEDAFLQMANYILGNLK